MRLLNRVTNHQKMRKIEIRYDLEQLSAPYDNSIRRIESCHSSAQNWRRTVEVRPDLDDEKWD